MNNSGNGPYICPNCHREYPLPPKACSCESQEIIEETKYYYLTERPEGLEGSESVTELDAKEITKDEFTNPADKGFYVEETFSAGIETIGSFYREIKQIHD